MDVWCGSRKQNVEYGVKWAIGCGGAADVVRRGQLGWLGHPGTATCRHQTAEAKILGECVRQDLHSLNLKQSGRAPEITEWIDLIRNKPPTHRTVETCERE